MASLPHFNNNVSEAGNPPAVPQAQFGGDKPVGQAGCQSQSEVVDQPIGGVGDTKSYGVTTIGRRGEAEADPRQRSEYVPEESRDDRKHPMLGRHIIGDRVGGSVHETGERNHRESEAGSYESTNVGRAAEAAGVASQEHHDPESAINSSESSMNDAGTRQHTDVQSSHIGPSFTDKFKGKAEKAAGKIAGNDAMMQRGEERQVDGGSR